MQKPTCVSSENKIGVVYTLLADTTLDMFSSIKIVEVYESEVKAYERKDKLERDGYKEIKIAECHIRR